MMELVQLRISRSHSWGSYLLHVFQRAPMGGAKVVTGVEWTEVEQGVIGPEPLLHVDREDIQTVMDELWRCGIRPSEAGTAGHVEALASERDYLRSLVDRVLPSGLRK